MSLITEILNTSRRIPVDRNEYSILAHLMEEVGELAEEISITCGGKSYKESGPDGIIGESVDTILCAIDMIYIHAKKQGIEITEEQLIEIAKNKLAKWESKCQQLTTLSNATLTETKSSFLGNFLLKLKQLCSIKNESR
jgi:hypothetical protein